MTGHAPNWDEGQVLSWSGRWHIIAGHQSPHDIDLRALCGIYGYTRKHVPTYSPRLQHISRGIKQAPLCKKCAAAQEKNML